MSESNYMEQVEPVSRYWFLKMIVKHTGLNHVNNPQVEQETLLEFTLKVKMEKDLSIPRNIPMVQEQWQDTLLKVVTPMMILVNTLLVLPEELSR